MFNACKEVTIRNNTFSRPSRIVTHPKEIRIRMDGNTGLSTDSR